MRQLVKKVLWRTPLYDLVRQLRHRRELRVWERRGGGLTPPPGFKQTVVHEYAERFSLRVLVETGTLFGDMVFAARDTFAEIYSIELDRQLYERATWRFRHDDHVHIVPGDSYEMLSAVLPEVAGRPALFWLDAHLMGGGVGGKLATPVIRELRDILESDLLDYVILADDARLFTSGSGTPTLDEVKQLVAARHPDWIVATEHDILRIHRRPP